MSSKELDPFAALGSSGKETSDIVVDEGSDNDSDFRKAWRVSSSNLQGGKGHTRQGLSGLRKDDITTFLVYHRIMPTNRLGSYLSNNILSLLYKYLLYDELVAVTSTCTTLYGALKEIAPMIWNHFYDYYSMQLLSGAEPDVSVWEADSNPPARERRDYSTRRITISTTALNFPPTIAAHHSPTQQQSPYSPHVHGLPLHLTHKSASVTSLLPLVGAERSSHLPAINSPGQQQRILQSKRHTPASLTDIMAAVHNEQQQQQQARSVATEDTTPGDNNNNNNNNNSSYDSTTELNMPTKTSKPSFTPIQTTITEETTTSTTNSSSGSSTPTSPTSPTAEMLETSEILRDTLVVSPTPGVYNNSSDATTTTTTTTNTTTNTKPAPVLSLVATTHSLHSSTDALFPSSSSQSPISSPATSPRFRTTTPDPHDPTDSSDLSPPTTTNPSPSTDKPILVPQVKWVAGKKAVNTTRKATTSYDNTLDLNNVTVLNSLIRKLTPALTTPESLDLHAFLHSYRTVQNPAMLICKLIQRFHVPRTYGGIEADTRWHTKIERPIQLRVCGALKRVIEDPAIPWSPMLLHLVKSFIRTIEDPMFTKLLSRSIIKRFPPPRPIIYASGPLLTRVFGFLDFYELCKIQTVCKAWNETVNQPFIWKALFRLYDDTLFNDKDLDIWEELRRSSASSSFLIPKGLRSSPAMPRVTSEVLQPLRVGDDSFLNSTTASTTTTSTSTSTNTDSTTTTTTTTTPPPTSSPTPTHNNTATTQSMPTTSTTSSTTTTTTPTTTPTPTPTPTTTHSNSPPLSSPLFSTLDSPTTPPPSHRGRAGSPSPYTSAPYPTTTSTTTTSTTATTTNQQTNNPPNVFDTVNIKKISLAHLVENLTPVASLPDALDIKAFMTTYRSFITTSKLVRILLQRFLVPRNLYTNFNEQDFKLLVEQPIQLRVCKILRILIEDHSTDLNPTLLIYLKIFVRGIMDKRSPLTLTLSRTLLKLKPFTQSPPTPTTPSNNNNNISNNNNINNNTTTTIIPLSPSPSDEKNPTSKDKKKLMKVTSTGVQKVHKIDLSAVHPSDIARQLTLMEHAIFSEIKPTEFFHQGWSKSDSDRRSPNIRAAIARFNFITKWIVTSVLREEKIKQRVKVMTRFINVARHLRKLNNFHTLMAFLAGINDSPVYRLKYTRAELPPKQVKILEELQSLMNADTNYEQYRQTLASMPANEPCIPYLGMFLRDLTYFEEDGNASSEEGLINFKQSKNVYSVLNHILIHQQCPYPFDPNPPLQEMLSNLPVIESDDELFKLSLIRESRTAKRSEIL